MRKRRNSAAPNWGPLSDQKVTGTPTLEKKSTDMADDSTSGSFGVAKCDHVRPTTKTINHDEEITAVDVT